MLVLEVAVVEKLDEAESIAILFEAAQVGTVELDTAMLGGVELDKGEIDAVRFEETEIGGVELDAAEGSTVEELETGKLTAVLHVVVAVGPSVDVKGDDFHKPRQQDNKCMWRHTLRDFSCLPPVIVRQFFTMHENMPFTCFKWTKPFSAKVSGTPQTA